MFLRPIIFWKFEKLHLKIAIVCDQMQITIILKENSVQQSEECN